MTSNEIRESFLNFFEQKGHKIVPSAPMVVKDDPTLMFTNAGMNQFKDWFLGNSTPQHKRVADTQKCLRVSGKHNDLDEVGHDTYHHTMFEMLGNWSFGDYFKKEAIEWAWELLTKIYKLDPNRLYATVFEGDSSENISADNEAYQEWLKYLPAERIINGNKKDNFWEMGDTGPCGPCSEIHIDLRDQPEREKLDGAQLVNTGHHLVIEIWNLVFIQFNRKADGSLQPLPSKHVDTGMGLERLCMAMQKKKSNYDTDVFTGMINKISEITKIEYIADSQIGISMRVISDHIRAISFSIADGQLPSNVKAGYVIRRILRRAVRYAYTFLNSTEPLLCKLVPTLIENMGSAFPELISQKTLIENVIREEEESFLRTLDKGIKLIETLIQKNSDTKEISGEEAFILYDTYGFPFDLTLLIAKEHDYKVDQTEFEKQLEKQKERSRKATSSQEGDWITLIEGVEPIFTGYTNYIQENVKVVRYREVTSKNRSFYQLVLDQSPFYAESGGQVGDKGVLTNSSGVSFPITNTLKENNLSIHICDRLPDLEDNSFTAKIDLDKRLSIQNNHTATHLLHKALRDVLGEHIEQKGSMVDYDRLRFDFSHFQKISDSDIKEIENRVNALIRQNITQQEHNNIDINSAKEMGAMALFGEKYGESVRVIEFGESKELCGGTHTSKTGNIGLFKIISESAIAAGIRRIEACSGDWALNMVHTSEDTLKEIKAILGNSPNIINSITKLNDENKSLTKQIEELNREIAKTIVSNLMDTKQTLANSNLLILKGEYSTDIIKNIVSIIRNNYSNSILISGTTHSGKVSLSLAITDDITKKGINASNEIKDVASMIKGGGGGQNFFATAGGKDKSGIESAIDKLIQNLKTKLN